MGTSIYINIRQIKMANISMVANLLSELSKGKGLIVKTPRIFSCKNHQYLQNRIIFIQSYQCLSKHFYPLVLDTATSLKIFHHQCFRETRLQRRNTVVKKSLHQDKWISNNLVQWITKYPWAQKRTRHNPLHLIWIYTVENIGLGLTLEPKISTLDLVLLGVLE